ncbi:unnamed protein product [Polarella glacialis]|uniref:Uncharacterized protein n=1 Tax=Polarella glacialis TaxID=89957 RepID=A0A813GHD4_POLGL|nr:unnamed protein product [Polarella glacialis]
MSAASAGPGLSVASGAASQKAPLGAKSVDGVSGRLGSELPAGSSQAVSLASHLAACSQALKGILATIPPTPLSSGGEAENAMLRHHLGACGKFREARQVCAALKQEHFVVIPGDKIYVDPSVVPTLLSIRLSVPISSSRSTAGETSSRSGEKTGEKKPPGPPEATQVMNWKRHMALCDDLAARVRRDMTAILSGSDPTTRQEPATKRPRLQR